MTSTPTSPGERFLMDFHRQHPGLTADCFLAGVVGPEGSSYHALVNTLPAGPEPLAVLDLACGDGVVLQLVGARLPPPLRRIGVDLSPSELAAARRRLGPDVELIQARAQHLPLPTGGLDAVLCHMALMLMDPLDEVLAEISRVLRPGGHFAAVVGRPSETCPAGEHFLRGLRERLGARRLPPLGDKTLRVPEAARALLLQGGRFASASAAPLTWRRRCPPAEAWRFYEGTYDVAVLDPDQRRDLEGEFTQACRELVDESGRVELTAGMTLLCATTGSAA